MHVSNSLNGTLSFMHFIMYENLPEKLTIFSLLNDMHAEVLGAKCTNVRNLL